MTRGPSPIQPPPWAGRITRPCRLSNNTEKKTFHRPGLPKPKNGHGTIDYTKKLWQHSSTEKGVSGSLYKGCFAYGLDDEWVLICEHALWIEFQDRTRSPWTLYRISTARANRTGHMETTPNGDRWLVPIEEYEVVEVRAFAS